MSKKRTASEIRAMIEELEQQLVDASSLKTKKVTVTFTVEPYYDGGCGEYTGIVTDVECKSNPALANTLSVEFDSNLSRNVMAAIYGEDEVTEAEEAMQ